MVAKFGALIEAENCVIISNGTLICCYGYVANELIWPPL